MITIDKIKDAISQLFRFEIIEETETVVKYNIQNNIHGGQVIGILDKLHIATAISCLNEDFYNEGLCIHNSTYYEVLVQRNSSRIFSNREISVEDNANKVRYILDKPSEKFIYYFLDTLYTTSIMEQNRILRISPHALSRYIDEVATPDLFNQSGNEHNIIDIIQLCTLSLQTIQVICLEDKDRTKTELESLLYAFLFNLGYNTGNTVTPYRCIEEYIVPYRLRRRRYGSGNFDAPRRKYNNELVLHYQKGLSSDNVDHNFLSFYHILEYYFESIYNDDIIKKIKDELTKPSFSYKRKNDIEGLVKVIKKRLQYKNEEFSINEVEALELTLRKFIPDISDLKNELEMFSPNAISFYKTNEVSFSKGNKVNLDNENLNDVYANLAGRIYKTRNAIVHSKETGKSKYTPFQDDKELIMEVYLIRIIAELVIIAYSTEI